MWALLSRGDLESAGRTPGPGGVPDEGGWAATRREKSRGPQETAGPRGAGAGEADGEGGPEARKARPPGGLGGGAAEEGGRGLGKKAGLGAEAGLGRRRGRRLTPAPRRQRQQQQEEEAQAPRPRRGGHERSRARGRNLRGRRVGSAGALPAGPPLPARAALPPPRTPPAPVPEGPSQPWTWGCARGWRLTQPRCAPVPAPVLGRLTQSVLRTWEAAGSAGERFRFGGVRRGPGSRLRERELRAGPRARTRSPWRPDSEAKASAHVSARGGDPRGPFLLSRAEGRFGDHIEGRGGPPRLRTVWSGVPGRRQRRLASSWRGTFRGPRGPKAWASGRGARVPLGQPCGNPGRAGFRPGRAACPGP